MNTATEPRYTVEEAASGGWWVLDSDKPEHGGIVVWSPLRDMAELLASLLNRAEVQKVEIEWLREQHERLESMVIALQDRAR